ncbi:MAG: hypothetical protein Q4G16_03225 [Cruoricaptor ignavus]|nr:hypothetical protein [Cruoricaptor ignavus]
MRVFWIFVTLCCPVFYLVFAQQTVSGRVVAETGSGLQNVLILNMKTDEKTKTSSEGFFIIKASEGDELRFVKANFERVSIDIKKDYFSQSLVVKLRLVEQKIEEVKITFKPSGKLDKDSRSLDVSQRVASLNQKLSYEMKIAPKQAYPSNRLPSTLPQNSDFSAGTVNLGGLAKALIGVAKRTANPKTEPNYAERQAFYKRVKSSVNLEKYRKYGLSEYDFDRFLAYADNQYHLAKNYRSNFNLAKINFYLDKALRGFLETQNKVSMDSIKI